MTTLIDYLNEPSNDFISKRSQHTLLSKRVTTADFDDLTTKKIKTKNADISREASLQHSPLTEETQSKSCDASEDRSMAIEVTSEDEHPLGQKLGKIYSIPSFESSTQCSLNGNDMNLSPMESLSRMSSSQSVITSQNSSTLINKSEQESAELLSEALQVLRMKFMARDETAFLQETLMKFFLSQEPKRIPPFIEFNKKNSEDLASKEKNKLITKIDDQSNIIYGEVEFPLLPLSMPFNTCQEQAQQNTSELTLREGKVLKLKTQPSVSSTHSKSSSLVLEMSKNIAKQKKNDSKDSLAATRAGTQRSDSDDENAVQKNKKEKKMDQLIDNNRKKNPEISQSLYKEEAKKKKIGSQIEFTEKPYAFSLKQKKSRAERQRTRWETVSDGKFSISDYFTQVLNAGTEDPKKKIQVPIGEEYQADLSTIPFKQGRAERRKLKMIWDPSSHSQNELNNFLKGLKTCLKVDVIQETAINLLIRNNNDVKMALHYAKNNKAKCLKELI